MVCAVPHNDIIMWTYIYFAKISGAGDQLFLEKSEQYTKMSQFSEIYSPKTEYANHLYPGLTPQ